MDVKVHVINQELKVATNIRENFAIKTQQFVRFIFDLPSDWDNLTGFAQFIQGGNGYNSYLDAENSAYLPTEIGAGTCYLVLCGTGNSVRATTNFLTLKINDNKLIEDAQSTVISQSLYEQLVDIVRASVTSPLVATTASQMTDKSRIYVYTGSQSGYNNGHWYYWNGSAWTDGGVYNAVATDDALSTSSVNAVQNKVVTAAINSILNNIATLEEIQAYIP